MRLDPDDARACYSMAAAPARQGKPEAAIASCEDVLRIDSRRKIENTLADEAKTDEAIAH